MEKITLVILAAGMGSRFGGLKQIEPVDPEGHIIIDFSMYDAWRAGFRDVVFIIKREMEAEFRECFENIRMLSTLNSFVRCLEGSVLRLPINVCTVEKSRFLELEGDFTSPKRM